MSFEMRLSGPETQPLCDEFDVLNVGFTVKDTTFKPGSRSAPIEPI